MIKTIEKPPSESQDTTHVQDRDYHLDCHPMHYIKSMRGEQRLNRVTQSSQDIGDTTPKDEKEYWREIAMNSTRNCYWLSASNPKALKGLFQGYVTVTLSLAPSNFSGKQVCYRDKHCRDNCLYWQGRGRMPQIQDARINKTVKYHNDPELFAKQVCRELETIQDNLSPHNLKVACRLNCFSDIRWESKVFKSLGGHTLFQANPNVQFYDYTKYPWGTRDAWANMPRNYHLTYSYDGTKEDLANCYEILDNGHNVMSVYNKAHFNNLCTDLALGCDLLSPWGFKIINAEASDNRFLDPKPAICIGLEKGRTQISI